MAKKIRLGVYPYTYVRVMAMKSMLLRREEYDKLLKMSFAEISRYLGESEYKKDINELALTFAGADLLEAALNRNLISTFNKLWRISPDELDLLINVYVKRNDFFNIKTLIRGKLARFGSEKIKMLLKPVGLYTGKFYEKALKEESIENILKMSGIIKKKELEILMTEFAEANNLMLLENALDRAYFSYVFEFSGSIPKQGALFKEFLLAEIDALNVKLLVRLKKEKMDKKELVRHLCFFTRETKQKELMNMVNKDYEALIKALEKTEFKKIVKTHEKELLDKKSLVDFETDLDKYVLKKSTLLLHQHPLSADIILGYMFAKDIEVTNLKAIVKGKQLGLSNEMIDRQLVVA